MQTKRAPLSLEITLIVVGLLFLLPILYALMMSIKEPGLFYKPLSLPHSLYFDYYKQAFHTDLFRGFKNSALVTAGTLGLTILVASLAGYSLSRNGEPVFRFFFLLFMTGMIIPSIGSLIPLFKLVTGMHLANTRTALVLMYTAGMIPFGTFLYAAFTKSIPRELEEASSIDGCGPFRLFFVVIFPLLLPATGTLILTQVYGVWNDFVTPLIFLNTADKMTLMPMIVQFMFNKQSTNYGPVFALCVLAMVPLLLLFLFTQRYMLKGLVIGSVKG